MDLIQAEIEAKAERELDALWPEPPPQDDERSGNDFFMKSQLKITFKKRWYVSKQVFNRRGLKIVLARRWELKHQDTSKCCCCCWIMCNVDTRLLLMVNAAGVLPIVASVHCGYNVVTRMMTDTPAKVCLPHTSSSSSDFLDITLVIIIIVISSQRNNWVIIRQKQTLTVYQPHAELSQFREE